MRQPFFDNLDKKDTCIFLYLTGAFAIAFFGTKKCQKINAFFIIIVLGLAYKSRSEVTPFTGKPLELISILFVQLESEYHPEEVESSL